MFCVGGDELYFKLLNRAITTLRLFDNKRPICILTEDVERAKSFCNFDNVVFKQFLLFNHLVPTVHPSLPWHRYGFYPKIFQFMYSPFDYTMFFDVDTVFLSDFTFFWERLKTSPYPLMIPGLADAINCSPPGWHWGWIFSVIQKSGICVPQTNSSFMIYNKLFVKSLIENANHVLMNLENWGCRPQFSGGYPDEIVMSLLIGILKIRPSEEMFAWVHDPTKILSCDKNV